MTTATVDLDDPFAEPVQLQRDRDAIISGGRYRLPNRDGSHHKGGWTRVSNLVGAISDAFGLRDWELRNLLTGLSLDVALYAHGRVLVEKVGADPDGLKPHMDAVAEILERAKAVAGGNAGSDYGTREHAMVEAYHRDMTLPSGPPERQRLHLYAQALADARLSPEPGMQERRVMIESANACGTLDNILRCVRSGWLHVGDLKTQKKFWSWLEIEAQLAGYAYADAMWDAEAGVWVDMPAGINRARAAVLWLPNPAHRADGKPLAQVRSVDIERGWDTFRLAHQVYSRRSEAKSARQEVSGLVGWTPVAPIGTVEAYAARFGTVESRADGSALVLEATMAGAWGPELEQCARIAMERIRATA